jgi:hypothetical protein
MSSSKIKSKKALKASRIRLLDKIIKLGYNPLLKVIIVITTPKSNGLIGKGEIQ